MPSLYCFDLIEMKHLFIFFKLEKLGSDQANILHCYANPISSGKFKLCKRVNKWYFLIDGFLNIVNILTQLMNEGEYYQHKHNHNTMFHHVHK